MATCEGKGKLTLSCGARTLLTVYENFSCSTNFASLPLQYWLSPAFLSILRPEGRVIQGLWKKKNSSYYFCSQLFQLCSVHLCRNGWSRSCEVCSSNLLSNLPGSADWRNTAGIGGLDGGHEVKKENSRHV